MAGTFGVEVFRVWMLNIGIATPDGNGGYIVSLKQGELVKVQELVAKLKDNGVKQIVALQGPLIPYDFPKFVGQSGQSYSQEDIDNGSNGDDTLIRADKYAFPEPGTTEYAVFMNVQVEYYRLLSEALPDITYFEGINEPEKGGSVHKIGWLSSNEQAKLNNQSSYNLSNYEYTITEIAQITMDYNHAMTEGVRKANTGAKVLSSGLMTIALTKTYLTEAYKYITSETNYYKDTNPDNYFEILNWHPYVFIGTNEDTRLPYSTAATWDKENWADTWVKLQKDLYQIAADYGDGDTPVWFTEFGISDCTGTDKSYEQNITETMTSIRLQDMFDLVEKELDFVNTVIVFRMFDLQDGTNTAYECNFGMVEYFGNITSSQTALKEIGKTFYQIVNKSNDYTKVNTVLDKYYEQFGY